MSERIFENDPHILSDDSNLGRDCASNNIPNQTTLDTIEKSERGFGLNGPFESLDEMLHALNDDNVA